MKRQVLGPLFWILFTLAAVYGYENFLAPGRQVASLTQITMSSQDQPQLRQLERRVQCLQQNQNTDKPLLC
jgi:hypothetical protein